jgi:hypothetical protein
MNKIKIVLSAVLVAAAGGAFAQTSDTSRDQRMDSAYTDYKAAHPNGAMSSSGSSMKGSSMSRSDRPSKDKSFGQNMKAAGSQIAEGGRDVGHDVAQGARKTGHAIHKGASKVGDKAHDMTTDKPAPTK